MGSGTIVTLHLDKGYGFVKPDTKGKYIGNYFFHVSDFIEKGQFDEINIGDRLSFLGIEATKGKKALNVSKL